MRVLEKISRKFLASRGYHIPYGQNASNSAEFFLYDYRKADGSFDYERYRSVQEEGNKKKIENVWADRPTIDFISDYLKTKNDMLQSGICHGVRRGNEQKWFGERLGIHVIGTDISETATNFANTVQWDFHERNPDWIGKFDFVYTNSHDHAYDPQKAIETWLEQLNPKGAVFLEHTTAHSESGASEMDPFGVDPRILPFLVASWSGGRYAVTDILQPPHKKPNGLNILDFCNTVPVARVVDDKA